MSGADVIELGSSDEELQQQPKAKKLKPPPNAMVHIPGKLPEVTITPTAASNSKPMHGKNIVFNGKVPLGIYQKIPLPKISQVKGTKTVFMSSNSPAKTSKNLLGKINCVQSKQLTKPLVQPHQAHKLLQNPIKIHNAISSLPPSITIKRTNAQLVKKPVKRKHSASTQPKFVPTVELDDDESPIDPLPAKPQWYVRPEDQTAETINQEDTNNKEPEVKNYIEITLEDSPVKPISKKTNADVSDLAVIIEDSPVKCKTPTKNKESGTPKKKNSRKLLVYPKEVLEIEIEPTTEQPSNKTSENPNNEASNTVIEVMESPMKVQDEVSQSPKKMLPTSKVPDPIIKDSKDIISIEDDTEVTEFHPVYQNFIDLCFKLENSDDMKKIVEKKIKAYYRQVPKKYTESEEFIDMVSSKILSMTAGPDKMYLYIKDIVDELNLQRKMAQNTVLDNEDSKKNEAQPFLYGEDSQFDAKRQRQIRKLEKTIKKLHRAIQKLEEQEVDFDDEDDSVYLLTERYKERMIKVHTKFCQLTNTKMPSEPRIHIDTTPGKPTGAARRLEKWINRKVPIGAPLPFPDFHDVLRCVRDANTEDNLGWNEVDILEEARTLFVRCGRKLQRRRQENEWRLAASRLSVDIDPAENNESLKKELDENRKTATNKETEVFNKFADRQNQLKLEAEEIGDKEADESPVDSEEEDVEDNVSLDNKEKRKERLKRLLQEKSANNKENNEDQNIENVEMKDLQGNTEQVEDNEIEKPTEEDNSISITNVEPLNNPSSCNNMDIDSDIDELHLLQKLHSEDEANRSSSESSDSASPISISDTLSDSDTENNASDDVISIENSSFSEADTNDKKDNLEKKNIVCSSYEEKKGEANTPGSSKLTKIDEDESEIFDELKVAPKSSGTLSIEGISLASSENDNSQSGTTIFENCVNLNDDAISIDETPMSSLYNRNELCNEAELENTPVADELGDSTLQPTELQDSQSNENILLPSEDEVNKKDKHPFEIIEDSLSIGETIAAKESEVNIEENNKNGLNKIAVLKNDDNKSTSLLNEGILLSSSEDDVSQDGNTTLVPPSDNLVADNDNTSSIIVTDDKSKDIQDGITKKHEEKKHLAEPQKTETEVANPKDKIDSEDLGLADENVTSANMESKNNTELKTILDESTETGKANGLSNGNSKTSNEISVKELDSSIDVNNIVCNPEHRVTESPKLDTVIELQFTDNELNDPLVISK